MLTKQKGCLVSSPPYSPLSTEHRQVSSPAKGTAKTRQATYQHRLGKLGKHELHLPCFANLPQQKDCLVSFWSIMILPFPVPLRCPGKEAAWFLPRLIHP